MRIENQEGTWEISTGGLHKKSRKYVAGLLAVLVWEGIDYSKRDAMLFGFLYGLGVPEPVEDNDFWMEQLQEDYHAIKNQMSVIDRQQKIQSLGLAALAKLEGGE